MKEIRRQFVYANFFSINKKSLDHIKIVSIAFKVFFKQVFKSKSKLKSFEESKSFFNVDFSTTTTTSKLKLEQTTNVHNFSR